MGRVGHRRCRQHWREILRGIRCANAYSNPDSDPKPNAYVYAMHGEMYTDTATAPYASTASITMVISELTLSKSWLRGPMPSLKLIPWSMSGC